MDVKHTAVARINPAQYNPREDLQPGDPEYEKLKRSIDEFGCVEPLVWNQRTGNLVGGHQRFKILQARGDTHALVSIVDLPPEREKALNVALNKISGNWDPRKLAVVLDEFVQMPDFDVELTGFEVPDAEALIAEVLHGDEREEEFDLEAALLPDEPANTQPGELIELGRHRLLCGDSSRQEDLQRLMDDEQADLLFTDPPYNVNYYGGNRPTPDHARPMRSRQWERIYADNLSDDEYTHWLEQVLTHATSTLLPGAPFYIWNGHRQFGPMYLILQELGLKVSCVITWAKESFAIGYGDYNQQTEFCLYGWSPPAPGSTPTPGNVPTAASGPGNNRRNQYSPLPGGHAWYGPTNESTLWEIRRAPTKSYVHPTQKPLELAERAMRNSTRAGDLVLDPFLGSGTTLIAAQRTGRRCFGLEIDPHYCDVIVRRYVAFIGEDHTAPELAERYRQQPAPLEVRR